MLIVKITVFIPLVTLSKFLNTKTRIRALKLQYEANQKTVNKNCPLKKIHSMTIISEAQYGVKSL